MKKLFISQPMKGKSDEDILKERNKAIAEAERLCDDVVEVLDSFFQGAPADAKPLWFLGKSLELLAQADVAYFAPGWADARGCKINLHITVLRPPSICRGGTVTIEHMHKTGLYLFLSAGKLNKAKLIYPVDDGWKYIEILWHHRGRYRIRHSQPLYDGGDPKTFHPDR